MKYLVFIALILCLTAISSFAQCAEPSVENTGKIIGSKVFELKNAAAKNEITLSLTAAAKNSSWEKTGAEAAVVTIFVDGKYNQDITIFGGAEKFDYRLLLGNFESGKHRLTVVLNKSRTAKNAGAVKIYAVSVAPVNAASAAEKIAVANAPLLYLRPDTIDKFSDIPLVTYYEILPAAGGDKIRYTTVFTNEDGGTQTRALMARWGRATDIEWVYEIEVKNGEIVSQIIQGANHVTKSFSGARVFGTHPVIFDATSNNNFDDRGCSPLRASLLPIRADLSKKSRESVMDENPWAYRIMAQEAMRENRVDPKNLGANIIDDLRNYLYVDVHSQNNSSAVAVEIQTVDGKTSRSDLNDAKLRVERSGYQRIAVRLPSAAKIQSVNLLCETASQKSASAECQNAKIVKFVKLDKNYNLSEIQNPDKNFNSVKAGEKLVWSVKNR